MYTAVVTAAVAADVDVDVVVVAECKYLAPVVSQLELCACM